MRPPFSGGIFWRSRQTLGRRFKIMNKIKSILLKIISGMGKKKTMQSVETNGQLGMSGNLQAVHIRSYEEFVSISENMQVRSIRKEKTIGFRETDSNGRIISSDLKQNGAVVSSVQLKIKPNEGNVPIVGRILAERLSDAKTKWQLSTDASLSIDIDCRLTNNNDCLDIQITRADNRSKIYKSIQTQGSFIETSQIDQLSILIKEAIESKAARIPEVQRKSIVLALDATDTPNLSLDPIVEKFRQAYGDWLRSLSFYSVWIVGPNVDLTNRLD
jgi:hypothetical protein